jgi:hypothetical protein
MYHPCNQVRLNEWAPELNVKELTVCAPVKVFEAEVSTKRIVGMVVVGRNKNKRTLELTKSSHSCLSMVRR